MEQCAVFVDAGYLFAQGSIILAGKRLQRSALALNADAIVDHLRSLAQEKAPQARLLRIYWYDGAIGGARPTTDQAQLAHLDDVKLRLGFINSNGQQKGVDSLIVTDLIELARLKSISDALLLSGDEDVRIGVQIAQSYGVRVHLLGIGAARKSQSQQLLQEADTTVAWEVDTIKHCLFIRPAEGGGQVSPVAESNTGDGLNDEAAILLSIERTSIAFADGLPESDIEGVLTYWATDRGIPVEMDGKLLAVCAQMLGRRLDRHEMQRMRASFRAEVLKRSGRV